MQAILRLHWQCLNNGDNSRLSHDVSHSVLEEPCNLPKDSDEALLLLDVLLLILSTKCGKYPLKTTCCALHSWSDQVPWNQKSSSRSFGYPYPHVLHVQRPSNPIVKLSRIHALRLLSDCILASLRQGYLQSFPSKVFAYSSTEA